MKGPRSESASNTSAAVWLFSAAAASMRKAIPVKAQEAKPAIGNPDHELQSKATQEATVVGQPDGPRASEDAHAHPQPGQSASTSAIANSTAPERPATTLATPMARLRGGGTGWGDDSSDPSDEYDEDEDGDEESEGQTEADEQQSSQENDDPSESQESDDPSDPLDLFNDEGWYQGLESFDLDDTTLDQYQIKLVNAIRYGPQIKEGDNDICPQLAFGVFSGSVSAMLAPGETEAQRAQACRGVWCVDDYTTTGWLPYFSDQKTDDWTCSDCEGICPMTHHCHTMAPFEDLFQSMAEHYKDYDLSELQWELRQEREERDRHDEIKEERDRLRALVDKCGGESQLETELQQHKRARRESGRGYSSSRSSDSFLGSSITGSDSASSRSEGTHTTANRTNSTSMQSESSHLTASVANSAVSLQHQMAYTRNQANLTAIATGYPECCRRHLYFNIHKGRGGKACDREDCPMPHEEPQGFKEWAAKTLI